MPGQPGDSSCVDRDRSDQLASTGHFLPREAGHSCHRGKERSRSCVPWAGAESHQESRDLGPLRCLGLAVGAGRGSLATLQAKPFTPPMTPFKTTPDLTRAPPIMCAGEPQSPRSRRRRRGGSAGPAGQRAEPGAPGATPSLPHTVFQKFKSAQNRENKRIAAHFNLQFPSYPLIYWLLESKLYRRVSVKDLFLASLYSYLCSHKNLEAAARAAPAPPTLRGGISAPKREPAQ